MASNPGVLTDWPWKPLGSYKYVILAPWVVHSVYSFVKHGDIQRDLFYLLILPFLLSRTVHHLLWNSLSRHRTAKGNNRILDKTIEFEQVDREANWDDQILLSGVTLYTMAMIFPAETSNMRVWDTKGVVLTCLLHIGPVEFLYYWLHRGLHHHYLYSRYHSHHHSSIVTEPITSVNHPFGEIVAYLTLFLIPVLTTVLVGNISLASVFGYVTYIDLMNIMGHCNFELIPNKLFSIFPPLKFLMYTPTFHSLHHTQFRTNYSLFVPLYDYIYGTVDKSTDSLYEASLKRQEDSPDVIHLTHLTTPDSIYHLRVGLPSWASEPQKPRWYLWLLWPITCWPMLLTLLFGSTFIEQRNTFGKLKLQSWVIPSFSHFFQGRRQAMSSLIEKAILEAEERGSKVLSLGLLNKEEELNGNGELYIRRNPKMKLKVVDGSSLSVAIVLNTIPKGTTQVLFRGNLSKVACFIVSALSKNGVQVATLEKAEYEKLEPIRVSEDDFIVSKSYTQKVWLVGDGLSDEEQKKAPKGTLFIPFTQFPLKKLRNDCFYCYPPSMMAPKSLENLHSCENWLPRRVMSASRVAGIVHALEGWNEHECGDTIFDVNKVWQAALKHGFQPTVVPNDDDF